MKCILKCNEDLFFDMFSGVDGCGEYEVEFYGF